MKRIYLLSIITLAIILNGCSSLFDDETKDYYYRDYVAIRSLNGPILSYLDIPDGNYNYINIDNQEYILQDEVAYTNEIRVLTTDGEYYRMIVPDMNDVVAVSRNRDAFVVMLGKALFLVNSDGSGTVLINDNSTTVKGVCFSDSGDFVFYWQDTNESFADRFMLMKYDIVNDKLDYLLTTTHVRSHSTVLGCANDSNYYYSSDDHFYRVNHLQGIEHVNKLITLKSMVYSEELGKIIGVEVDSGVNYLTYYDLATNQFTRQSYSNISGEIALSPSQTKILVGDDSKDINYLIDLVNNTVLTLRSSVREATFSSDGTNILCIVKRAFERK